MIYFSIKSGCKQTVFAACLPQEQLILTAVISQEIIMQQNRNTSELRASFWDMWNLFWIQKALWKWLFYISFWKRDKLFTILLCGKPLRLIVRQMWVWLIWFVPLRFVNRSVRWMTLWLLLWRRSPRGFTRPCHHPRPLKCYVVIWRFSGRVGNSFCKVSNRYSYITRWGWWRFTITALFSSCSKTVQHQQWWSFKYISHKYHESLDFGYIDIIQVTLICFR